MNWREFWNGEHSIYVNNRHRMLHYQGIARDITALIPSKDAVVLDHGCGEASASADIAARCGTLYLFDSAPNVREKLRMQFSTNPKIHILNDEALDALPDGALDMVVINSVLQYLSIPEFERLLELWHRKIKPGGRLVAADVIPPDVDAVKDVKALLTFARDGGFLIAAGAGLVSTFFSNYRKLRSEIGLTHYTAENLLVLLRAHDYTAERASKNIGHNPARMTFIATRN